jgi:hypothetical protein
MDLEVINGIFIFDEKNHICIFSCIYWRKICGSDNSWLCTFLLAEGAKMNINIFVTPIWVVPLVAVVLFILIKSLVELIP